MSATASRINGVNLASFGRHLGQLSPELGSVILSHLLLHVSGRLGGERSHALLSHLGKSAASA